MKSKLCVLAVAALVVWGMKRHYADAGADDLWWILSPTAQVVATVTSTAFVAVPSEGYVSYERLVVIEKSCAGINFLVAAFGMLTVALLHRVRSGFSGLCVIAVSLSAGYLAAVLVNATRITIALWLADRPSAVLALGASQVHRLEGIVVYFAGLVLLSELARRIDRRTGLTGGSHDRRDTADPRQCVSSRGSSAWRVLRRHARVAPHQRRCGIRHRVRDARDRRTRGTPTADCDRVRRASDRVCAVLTSSARHRPWRDRARRRRARPPCLPADDP